MKTKQVPCTILEFFPVTNTLSARVAVRMSGRRKVMCFNYSLELHNQIDPILKEIGVEEYSFAYLSPGKALIILSFEERDKLEERLFPKG